jgi:hypothetical protein
MIQITLEIGDPSSTINSNKGNKLLHIRFAWIMLHIKDKGSVAIDSSLTSHRCINIKQFFTLK